MVEAWLEAGVDDPIDFYLTFTDHKRYGLQFVSDNTIRLLLDRSVQAEELGMVAPGATARRMDRVVFMHKNRSLELPQGWSTWVFEWRKRLPGIEAACPEGHVWRR